MQAPAPSWIPRAANLISLLLLAAGLCALWLTGVSGRGHLAANLIGSYFILWGLVLLFVKGSRSELMARFALTSVTLGFILACAEATALIGGIDYRNVFGLPVQPARWQAPHRAFDSELGWVYRRYGRFSGTEQGSIAKMLCLNSPRYPYEAHFDRHGFRNSEDLDTADVAVIGDSFVEAVETPNDRIMTTVLSRLTGSVVANLGRGAYGPQQQLIVLRRYALPLRPKVLVWMFYEGNDLLDLALYDKMMAALRGGRVGVAPSWYQRSFTPNALGALVKLLRGCTPDEANWLTSATFRTAEGHDVWMHFIMYAQLPNDSWSTEHARALERVQSILRQAREATQAQGTELIVAFIPMGFRVYGNVLRCAPKVKCAEERLNDLPQQLKMAIAEVSPQTHYIDLTPLFVAQAKRGRLLYLPEDGHWTAEGHRLAAEAIAEPIRPLLQRQRPE